MYSLVLMAALTTGGEMPAFGHRGCGGCHGCCGCCGGCYGCHGCYGGGCYGCHGCHGCYGGGCCGGCWGCYGGCWGCYGGCCGGCWGSYGGVVSSYPAMMAPERPGTYGAPPAENVPAPQRRGTGGASGGTGGTDRNGGGGEVSLDRAKVIIDLPAQAKLYIDGRLMKTASAHRVFSTPTLQPGQLYYYDLRAEVARDGKVLSQDQRIIVSAGQQVQAAFKDFGAEATAKAESVVGR